MHHHDKYAHSQRLSFAPAPVADGASFRLLAAMAEPAGARPARHGFGDGAPIGFSAYERVARRSPIETKRQEELLDAALIETFPASDPVSVVIVG